MLRQNIYSTMGLLKKSSKQELEEALDIPQANNNTNNNNNPTHISHHKNGNHNNNNSDARGLFRGVSPLCIITAILMDVVLLKLNKLFLLEGKRRKSLKWSCLPLYLWQDLAVLAVFLAIVFMVQRLLAFCRRSSSRKKFTSLWKTYHYKSYTRFKNPASRTRTICSSLLRRGASLVGPLGVLIAVVLYFAVLGEHTLFEKTGLLPGDFEVRAFLLHTAELYSYVARGTGIEGAFITFLLIHLLAMALFYLVAKRVLTPILGKSQPTVVSLLPNTHKDSAASEAWNNHNHNPRLNIKMVVGILTVLAGCLTLVNIAESTCPRVDSTMEDMQQSPIIRLSTLSFNILMGGDQAEFRQQLAQREVLQAVMAHRIPPVPATYINGKSTWAGKRPPNVILIQLESTRADVTTPYHPELKTTPYYETLAQQGVVFERFYSVRPYTNKIVASVMCGRSAIVDTLLVPYFEVELLRANCLPQFLSRAGYKTLCGRAYSGWDHEQDIFESLEFDNIIPPELSRKNYYNDSLLFEEVAPWFEKHKDSPIFATLNPQGTHSPFDGIEVSCKMKVQDWSKFYQGQPPSGTYAGNLETWNRYLTAVHCQSESFVRRFIEFTKELGIYDNTIFFLMGDHGFEMFDSPNPVFGYNSPYPPGNRVPAILLGPGVPQGVVAKQPGYAVDFYRTIIDLVKLNVPQQLNMILDHSANLLEPKKDKLVHSRDTYTVVTASEELVVLDQIKSMTGETGGKLEFYFNGPPTAKYDPDSSPLMIDPKVRSQYQGKLDHMIREGRRWFREHSFSQYFKALNVSLNISDLPGNSQY